MPSGLVLLPLELLLNVISHLNFEDFVNLTNTQKQLTSLLGSEATCREVVKVGLTLFVTAAHLS